MIIMLHNFLDACSNTNISLLDEMLVLELNRDDLLNFYKKNYENSDFYNDIHPFRKACSLGNTTLISWFNKKQLNITDDDWFIGLELACNNNQIETIELLLTLNSDIDINGTFKDYDPILYTVCKNRNYQVFKFLLEITPNIDITVNEHEIFKYVCENELLEFAKLVKNLNNNYSFTIDEYGIIDYNITNIQNIVLPNANINDCPICYKKSDIITCCNHQFCKKCIQKWKEKSNKCPMCRKNFTLKYAIIT